MTSLPNLFSLSGKVALVTGGYRGLGLSIARGLGQAGARVYLNGRSSQGVEHSVQALQDEGIDARGKPFDITDEQAVTTAVAEIEQQEGAITILVNNAGIHRRNPLLEMSLEDFNTVIGTNLTAAFLVARAVVPMMMQAGGGKVINLCSLMSDLARPTTGNYAAAKGGLRMLTRAMAAEWAGKNIQINGIAPGYFETEMTRPLIEDPKFNSWICGRTPSGRWGQPEELRGVAVFLASEASQYINGQLIAVDGGLTAVV